MSFLFALECGSESLYLVSQLSSASELSLVLRSFLCFRIGRKGTLVCFFFKSSQLVLPKYRWFRMSAIPFEPILFAGSNCNNSSKRFFKSTDRLFRISNLIIYDMRWVLERRISWYHLMNHCPEWPPISTMWKFLIT